MFVCFLFLFFLFGYCCCLQRGRDVGFCFFVYFLVLFICLLLFVFRFVLSFFFFFIIFSSPSSLRVYHPSFHLFGSTSTYLVFFRVSSTNAPCHPRGRRGRRNARFLPRSLDAVLGQRLREKFCFIVFIFFCFIIQCFIFDFYFVLAYLFSSSFDLLCIFILTLILMLTLILILPLPLPLALSLILNLILIFTLILTFILTLPLILTLIRLCLHAPLHSYRLSCHNISFILSYSNSCVFSLSFYLPFTEILCLFA